jgi:sporulation protein YlmC with PRC-barrel domain
MVRPSLRRLLRRPPYGKGIEGRLNSAHRLFLLLSPPVGVSAPAGGSFRRHLDLKDAPVICLTEMLGCPVISARTGDRLGRVSQVLVDLVGRRIVGFRLRSGGLLDRRWRLAAMQDVSEVSPEAIVLPDDIALREDEQTETQLPLGGRPLTVIGTDGAEVGRLADVAAELSTGDLVDLRVIPTGTRTRPYAHPLVLPIDRVCRSERHAVVVDGADTFMQTRRTLRPSCTSVQMPR